MNIDLGKLFESRSGLLVVLGSTFILLAAIGGIPGQNTLIIEASWRYVVVGVGFILLIAGFILVVRDIDKDDPKKKAAKNLVRTFESDKKYADYQSRRLKEAKKSVCDLTYEGFTRDTGYIITFFTPADREDYIRTIEEISRHVKYREIIMFMGKENRISKAKRLIKNAGKLYQLAGYPDTSSPVPPRHNFIIIDDEEVFIAGLAISHPAIVDYYCRFYDDLWSSATPIKVSTVENFELVKIAEERASAAQPKL